MGTTDSISTGSGPRLWPWWAFLLIAMFLIVVARSAAAESGRDKVINDGRQEFVESCVACHGEDATGKGQLREKLIQPPKDLTEIAQRNGGKFPFWRIYEIITGERDVPGHETFQMPEYYARMRAQDAKPGFLPAYVRVLELTHYLESTQK